MRTKNSIASIVSITALVILLAGGLWWLSLASIRLSEQNAVLSAKIGEIQNKRNDYSGAKSETIKIKDGLVALSGYFVTSDQKVVAIDRLEKLAETAGVKYSLNNAIEGEKVSFDLTASGPFRNIYYFLKLLEQSGFWVSFDRLSLSRNAQGTWTGSMIISIPQI